MTTIEYQNAKSRITLLENKQPVPPAGSALAKELLGLRLDVQVYEARGRLRRVTSGSRYMLILNEHVPPQVRITLQKQLDNAFGDDVVCVLSYTVGATLHEIKKEG